ncbi:MAG: hypothetical protein ACREXV_19960 [Polaromonas sp.]
MYDEALKKAIEAEEACARLEAAAVYLHKRLVECGVDDDQRHFAVAVRDAVRACRRICAATVGTLLAASCDSAGVEVKGVVILKPATPTKA